MANHANLDTNAPHLASRGAYWHRVGCKLPWGGVHLAAGRGALWRRRGAFPEGGVHLDNHLQPNSVLHGIIYKRVHNSLLLVKPFYGICRLIR